MLKVENLHAYYQGNEALKGVSLEVNPGEIIALIGANGAGKTTLLNCISGLHTDMVGRISFRGADIVRAPAHKLVKQGLVQCPENRQLFGPMTVEENLEMGAYLWPAKIGSVAFNKRMEDVFQRFPVLKSRRKQSAGTLSGGEQQMVAIARGLMSDPKLLMLDEPSLGLAPIIVQEVFRIIKEMRNEGRTILLVEQNAIAALALSDRAYLLETGRVTFSGPSNVFMTDERVRRAYLGNDLEVKTS
ncbi:MAG: ABC transporter ATP-binding protein [Desulfomonilaceae bacterium]|jgi:branched-chain amino acid transport system ATP-binding protein